VARGIEKIILSQRKTDMLGCKPVVSPIDVKVNMSADVEEQVDHERYQRLVGRLIYLCHTHPDISFAVSCYMHDPRKYHMDAVFYILRYLKSAPGEGLIFRNN
jgi:hypothetical protein